MPSTVLGQHSMCMALNQTPLGLIMCSTTGWQCLQIEAGETSGSQLQTLPFKGRMQPLGILHMYNSG